MILRAMLAVAMLLVGPSMLDRSRLINQKQRSTLVLQGVGWANNPTLQNVFCYETATKASKWDSKVYEDSG